MSSEQIKIFTPRQALNKAYLKEKILRSEIDLFKNNLNKLFESIDRDEREENVKTFLRDFLNETYYKNKHFINTLRDVDLVVYHENNQNKAAVLMEVKRPKNKLEMITKENLNAKAMHELILYFLEERIEHNNNEIKYLIATNVCEWFIFDAAVFEHLFYNNKKLVKNYEHWRNKQKTSDNTDFFYDEIAKPLLEEFDSEISFVYFNLNDYQTLFRQNEKENEKKIIALYKILSPVHLLKQSFANDSNSLDRNFYNELLHILGLEETKEKNKKLINRKPEKERDPGSIIENTILILETENTIARIKHPEKYGETADDQIYGLALELSITWVNRILFLKLLEAQLYKYHNDDRHKFLNKDFINDFDELYKLFHQVLAVPHGKRTELINKKFGHVPYLNSSLFEISELESETIKINSLDDNTPIALSKNTVLKDRTGKKRSEPLPAMYYLFEFLDAYDFTSEGNEEIREDKKTLINASVLGLIFEKINGYKDGSFFTPGFITMYMCRETLQRAVVQKFNNAYRWKCKMLADVKNHLSNRRNTSDILEFNAVINSLKIVDPAVGSGHFLVSALNELIAIKSELGLLADKKGSLLTDYEARVENDELIITYNSGEDIFEYHAPKTPPFGERGIHDPHRFSAVGEVQRVQETLFNEKQTIIENCLFGVDINANSVKIARLRLWIELLKNAFYTEESGYTRLETIPNIDINIKEGNSLINRFPLNADLKSALKTIRYTIEDYKNFVRNYKNTNDKNEKNNFRRFIDDIKSNFISEISANDPRKKKLNNMVFELHNSFQTPRLIDIELSKKDKEKLKHDEKKLEEAIKKLREELDSEAGNVIYNNAFEWRFEFPEALDDEGNFVGFDVVIGNPPWGAELTNIEKIHFKDTSSEIDSSTPNTFAYFVGLAKRIAFNGVCLLLPDSILLKDFKKTRSLIKNNLYNVSWYQNTALPDKLRAFVDVEHDVTALMLDNIEHDSINCYMYTYDSVGGSIVEKSWENKKAKMIFSEYDNVFNLLINEKDFLIKQKLDQFPLLEKLLQCHEGIHSGNIRDLLFTKDNKGRDKKPLFIGAKNGDIIENYFSKTSGWYVDYRKDVIDKSKGFYASLREESIFSSPKIYITRTGNPFKAFLDDNSYASNNFFSLQFIDPKKNTAINLAMVLCFINSQVAQYYIRKIIAPRLGDTFIETKIIHLLKIPLPSVSENDKKNLISFVNKILSAKKKNPQADTSALEAEIDKLVYRLYGLTEDEIKIVEGK